MDTISNIRTIAGNKAIDLLKSSTQSYLILPYHTFPKSYFLGEAYLAGGDRAKATVAIEATLETLNKQLKFLEPS